MPISRKDFLKFSGLALAGSLAIATGILALKDEAQDPVIDHINIPLRGLKPALEGFSIVQISDIHLKPYTRATLVQRAVEMSNNLHPDLVVLTGDFVWRVKDAAFELAPLLAKLNARYGVYSVWGNHDYWLEINDLEAAFAEARLPVLTNQGLVINVAGESLYLAGLDDGWAGQMDLKAAMEFAPPGAPVILLLHEPDLVDRVSHDPRISLQLSGHTHGGQVLLPGKPPLFAPYLGKKYPQGLYKVNETWLYTNRGLGAISVPVRYNCPPEITYFTLTGA